MDGFDALFRRATANVSREYFLLPVIESPPIYRERVYCYELYHQLRCIWPPEDVTPLRLNGEIDKQGHVYFGDDRRAPKPDLLVHVPGTHNNYAAIEVKTVDGLRRGGLEKDIGTLARFMNEFGYARGIHLVVGAPATTTLDVLRQAGANPNEFGRIEFWGHAAPGQGSEGPAR